jgi:hypothetical protein
MMALFGPLSSAEPNGGGGVGNWFGIIIGGWVLITGWRKFLGRDPGTIVPLHNLIGLTVICGVIIGVGVWGLLH